MGLKILVAEDSPSVSLVYKKTLEKRGHMVVNTENGLKCLYQYADDFKLRGDDKKKTSLYDLVILDHKMPRMSGIDVAKVIISEYSNVPKGRVVVQGPAGGVQVEPGFPVTLRISSRRS